MIAPHRNPLFNGCLVFLGLIRNGIVLRGVASFCILPVPRHLLFEWGIIFDASKARANFIFDNEDPVKLVPRLNNVTIIVIDTKNIFVYQQHYLLWIEFKIVTILQGFTDSLHYLL
ncbi:protein of unknown function [Lactiplantibacillus plantarum]